MYESFFGLLEKPFNLTPDPRYFYLSESHREALAALIYGVRERVGLITLTGPVGVGKTMILASFLDQIREHADAALFSGSVSGSRTEFLGDLCSVLGITSEQDSLFGLSRAIKDFAVQEAGEDRQVVVLVDEAQDLGLEQLEHFHHLSNLETPEAKLLQIVLAGTEKLDEKLRDKSLEALWQRVAIRCAIKPIEPEETIAYILHRMRVAGSSSSGLFSEGALKRIVDYARGVPRLINLICNQAMLSAYSSGESPVGEGSVLEALRELEGDDYGNGAGEGGAPEGGGSEPMEKVEGLPVEETVPLKPEKNSDTKEGRDTCGEVERREEAGTVPQGDRRQDRFPWVPPRPILVLLLILLLVLAVLGVLVGTGLLKPGAVEFEPAPAAAPKGWGAGARGDPNADARSALPAPGIQDVEEGTAATNAISEHRAEGGAKEEDASEEPSGRMQRTAMIREQDLAGIALERYGRLDAGILKLLRETNPQIGDWNSLTPGVQIVLPELPGPTNAGVDFYTIQVGAFRVREGALRRASKLAEQGVQNLFLIRGGQDEKLTFVCAGVFESALQSSEAVERIRKMGFEDAFATRIKEKEPEQVLQPYAAISSKNA